MKVLRYLVSWFWRLFATRAKFIREMNKVLQRYDLIRLMLEVATPYNLAEIQRDMKNHNLSIDPIVLEGSDMGKMEVRLTHWTIGLLGLSFRKILDGFHDDPIPNFITMDLVDPSTRQTFTVTISRYNRETPAVRMKKDAEKIKELEETINRLQDH